MTQEVAPNESKRGPKPTAREPLIYDVLFDATGRPHLGEANVYGANIGPDDPEGGSGGVEFFLHVDWDSRLHVQVTITVLGEIEHFQVGG
jgi:hypothetical protein